VGDPAKFSDLIGLKEPIIKLIEVVSEGIGCVYEPRYIKKMADAKSYEINKITSSLKEMGISGEVKYEDSQMQLVSGLLNNESDTNVIGRMISKEIKRQRNLASIVSTAYDQLESIKSVSHEPVDEDWITRFFSVAEEITSEEMQKLWGKILAGEIATPRTYSLRTLDILKNINKDEAELFSSVGKYAIKGELASFIIGDNNYIETVIGISLSDRLFLEELNLLNNNIFDYSFEKSSQDSINEFKYAERTIIVNKKADGEHRIPIFKFTNCGEELLNFVESSFSEEYFDKFLSMIENENIDISY